MSALHHIPTVQKRQFRTVTRYRRKQRNGNEEGVLRDLTLQESEMEYFITKPITTSINERSTPAGPAVANCCTAIGCSTICTGTNESPDRDPFALGSSPTDCSAGVARLSAHLSR